MELLVKVHSLLIENTEDADDEVRSEDLTFLVKTTIETPTLIDHVARLLFVLFCEVCS